MGFKNFINESNDAKLKAWKKAFHDFSLAADKLSSAWEDVNVNDKDFLNAYQKLFKKSFHDLSYDLMELDHKASRVK